MKDGEVEDDNGSAMKLMDKKTVLIWSHDLRFADLLVKKSSIVKRD